MAYRGEDAGDVLEAATLDGKLVVGLGANRLALTVGTKNLHLADKVATVVDAPPKKKPRRTSFSISGVVFARGVPREDVAVWVEAAEDSRGPRHASSRTKQATWPPLYVRRIFGVSPMSLLEASGLQALAKLDSVALRLRSAVEDYTQAVGVWSARATEIGGGHPLDKVLLADFGGVHAIYARKLFRDRARMLMSISESAIVVNETTRDHEIQVTSKFGITVRGDFIRFADRNGSDLARISVPWLAPEDREELARRIGALVHRG